MTLYEYRQVDQEAASQWDSNPETSSQLAINGINNLIYMEMREIINHSRFFHTSPPETNPLIWLMIDRGVIINSPITPAKKMLSKVTSQEKLIPCFPKPAFSHSQGNYLSRWEGDLAQVEKRHRVKHSRHCRRRVYLLLSWWMLLSLCPKDVPWINKLLSLRYMIMSDSNYIILQAIHVPSPLVLSRFTDHSFTCDTDESSFSFHRKCPTNFISFQRNSNGDPWKGCSLSLATTGHCQVNWAAVAALQ